MITSDYGPRLDPFHGRPCFHHGIDIAGPVGAVVRTPLAGLVVAMGTERTAGRWLAVQPTTGPRRLYVFAHLGAWRVRRGQHVAANQVVGTIGMTGRTTGPHLHFEVCTPNGSRRPLAAEVPKIG